jgi:glycerol-3-phosphate acyltransferase PlsY
LFIWGDYTGSGVADITLTAALALAAFWLGALPFSLWLGYWLLGRDIRDYGDGNPGAFNVFRAGGRKTGGLAILLDIAKGVPLVTLAQSYFSLPEATVLVVALGAILGSAFSPVLRFGGGKSIAVTFGVLLAIQPPVMLVTMAACLLLGFIILEENPWATMVGPIGVLTYLISSHASFASIMFMLCLLAVFAIKQFPELRSGSQPTLRVVHWLQSRRRGE